MVNTPQQIDRLDQAPDSTIVAAMSHSTLTPYLCKSAPQCVPRPHIPISAFADAGNTEAVVGQAVDEDEYDDSAIIVIEDRDGEWQCDSGDEPESTTAREEVEPQSEYRPPFGSSVQLIGGGSVLKERAKGQDLASLLDLSLCILVADQPRILGQETVMPFAAPNWATTFAARTEETAELLEHTATEIPDRPSCQKTKGIEGECIAVQQPQTISRNLAIHECYREAAEALERLIVSKSATIVLIVIAPGDKPEPTHRDLSLSESVTSFTYPLALALSTGRRVLAVDLVSNAVCSELGFQSGAGILGVACGRLAPAEAVLATASPQVDLLPFGAVEFEQNTERSLDFVRLVTAIATLAREYDLVLITVGIEFLIEEFRLARTIDLAVLAAPSATTTVESIKSACARLESIGIQPAGILLLDSASRAFSASTD